MCSKLSERYREALGLHAGGKGVCVHHEATDEYPPLRVQDLGDLQDARPGSLPVAGRFGDVQLIAHDSASRRASSRCRAALLSRSSP